MAILGVNGSTSCLYLALVSDAGEVLDGATRILPPQDTSVALQLTNVMDEAVRIFETFGVSKVVILDAEANVDISFRAVVPRVSMETAVILAAHRHGISAERRSRAGLRSKLGLSAKGKLSVVRRQVLDEHAPYWDNKRDLAALVALAETRA